MKVKFMQWDCDVDICRYKDDYANNAIVLGADNMPITTASINVSSQVGKLPDDLVAIKDYSENEGMLAALVAAGIVESDVVGVVPSGFVEIPVCRLTSAAQAQVQPR